MGLSFMLMLTAELFSRVSVVFCKEEDRKRRKEESGGYEMMGLSY